MPTWLLPVLRTAAQSINGAVVAWLVSRGIDVPIAVQEWWVQVLFIGGGVGVATAVLRWLETRRGDGIGARLARGLARLLMVGLGGRQPVYVPPAEVPKLRVMSANGVPRTLSR
jgi:hypothetical protein